MRYLGLALSAFLLTACSAKDDAKTLPLTVNSETLRSVSQGPVLGFTSETGAHVWRAVPYGADTSGENRWRAPRPAPTRSETYEALDFGPVCPQIATPFTPVPSFVNGALEGSEDCLTFDIYAPPDAIGKNLPVMMWIHGGGNVSGTSQLYVGDRLAVNEDVIIMAVQYRLGPLGWFSHPALRDTAQTPADKAANFALLDQIAALRWIQDNAASFGGDPNNVTIFGESAGGHNVAALLASPMAKGLFHKAILQSGSFDSVSVSEAETSAELLNPSRWVGEKLGVENFHSASTQEVFSAFDLTENGGFMELPRVIEDGVSLPKTAMRDIFSSRENFANVPIITGTNRDEMKLFFLSNPELTKKTGPLYKARDPELYDAASDYSGRDWRLSAVDEPIALMNAAGHDAVYAYRFDWDEGGKFLTMDLSKLLGAAHAMEIPFVFNRFVLLGEADDIMFQDKTEASRQELSRTMGTYWANFARTGVPSAPGSPAWGPYGSGGTLMHFDSRNDRGIRIESGPDTSSAIITDIAADPRIDNEQRCKITQSLTRISDQDQARAAQIFNCAP